MLKGNAYVCLVFDNVLQLSWTYVDILHVCKEGAQWLCCT